MTCTSQMRCTLTITLRIVVMYLGTLSAVLAVDSHPDDLRLIISPTLARNFTADADYEIVNIDNAGAATRRTASGNGQLSADVQYHRRIAVGYYHSLSVLQAGQSSFTWGVECGYDEVSETQEQLHLQGRAWLLTYSPAGRGHWLRAGTSKRAFCLGQALPIGACAIAEH